MTGPSNGGLTAVILAGGLGTRLRSAVPDRPKPMALVRGRPFLERLVAQAEQSGFYDIVLCVGYQSNLIEDHFGNGHHLGVRIAYSREQILLGTAGALLHAQPLIKSDPFLTMNGDSYCATDLTELAAQHRIRNAVATMAAVHVEDSSRYGSLELDAENAVLNFRDKDAARGPGWINAGIYVLNQSVLGLIPSGTAYSMERNVFPALAGRGLYAAKTPAIFIDIGIPSEFERVQTLLHD